MNRLNKIAFLAFFFSLSTSSFSQEYDQVIYQEFKMPFYGLKLESSSFQVNGIIDDRENTLQIGEIYYQDRGKIIVQVTDELPAIFNSYFDQAMRLTKIGNEKVIISFTSLYISENEPNNYITKKKPRHFKIAVNYYLEKEKDTLLLWHDQLEIDTLIREKKYTLDDFTYDFFYQSFRDLNKYISTVKLDTLSQKYIPPIDTLAINSEIDTSEIDSLYEGQVFYKKRKKRDDFEGIILPEKIQNAIIDAYAEEDNGKYLLGYSIVEVGDEIKINELTQLKATKRLTVHPIAYVLVPILIIRIIYAPWFDQW